MRCFHEFYFFESVRGQNISWLCFSLLVFAALALYGKNTVGYFYLAPEEETKEVLGVLSVLIRIVCSMLFISFPTMHHKIRYLVSDIRKHTVRVP